MILQMERKSQRNKKRLKITLSKESKTLNNRKRTYTPELMICQEQSKSLKKILLKLNKKINDFKRL